MLMYYIRPSSVVILIQSLILEIALVKYCIMDFLDEICLCFFFFDKRCSSCNFKRAAHVKQTISRDSVKCALGG